MIKEELLPEFIYNKNNLPIKVGMIQAKNGMPPTIHNNLIEQNDFA